MKSFNGVTTISADDVRNAAKEIELLKRNTKSDEEIADALKPSVSLQCWGHGENGWVVTVFGSYNEREAQRAAELIQWLLDAAKDSLRPEKR